MQKKTAVNIEPRYEDDRSGRLRGYEVTRSVTIVLSDLAKLDPFLDGAVQAGANHEFEVTLTSSRGEELRKQALMLALEDAKTQAQFAAGQLGARIGPVRSIDLNSERAGVLASARIAPGSPAARFLPGTIRITSQVLVVFSLEDSAQK